MFWLWLVMTVSHAAEVTEIAPIVRDLELSPADELMADPVVPKQSGAVSEASASGGIDATLSREAAVPLTYTGQPGAAAQIRGFGRSAEDVQTQMLGVPLNPPQGGGFDFSVFPAYLWSRYGLQLGAVAGGPDPRGVSGALSLTPWTADALAGAWEGRQVVALCSGAGFGQFAARGASEHVAAVLGYSVGDAHGPSGALSAAQSWGSARVSAHLVASDIDTESLGSRSYPTPRARQRSARWVPILQADLGERRPSVSAFYDGGKIRYEDPDSAYLSDDRIQQWGVQAAWRPTEIWRFGALVRRTTYQKLDFDAPTETQLQAQVTRTHRFGERWILEPTFQALVTTRFGLSPTESLGARYRIEEAQALFARLSFTKKAPTLADRYYVYPGLFTGNPALKPETVWSGVIGWENAPSSAGALAQTIEADVQYRADAQVNSTLAGGVLFPVNQGSARILSVRHRAKLEPIARWELSNVMSWSSSHLSATNQEFPYQPTWIDVARLKCSPAMGWSLGWDARFSSGALASATTGKRVGGYGLHDLWAEWESERGGLKAGLRLQNALNRAAEPISDYPVLGRTLVGSVTGTF